MGSEWQSVSFGQLIVAGLLEIGDGYRAKNSELGGDGPIFLRAGHVRDTHIDLDGVDRFHRQLESAVASKMSAPGDVIVTTKGNSTGRVAFIDDRMPPVVYSPHLSYWRSLRRTSLVPGYLRYWSRSAEFRDQLSGLASSTDMAPYLSLVDQRRLRITLPPPAEQERIARILGALDDKIELNRRMSRTLESIARALFDRATAGRPMVPYHTALGVRMGAPFKGGAFSSPGHGRPLLRIRDLSTFVSDICTTEIRGDETVIRPGDIVVGMDAEFRATLWLGPDSVLNQRVCSFRGLNGVGRAFVLHAIEPELARQEQAKTGTTVIHLNKADIDSFTVPELNTNEHRHLSATTEPLVDLIVAEALESRMLLMIRDALIPGFCSPSSVQEKASA